MENENFERIATEDGLFFKYVVGHFKDPDVYVIGTMDMKDPVTQTGGESENVFYFLITPEEYSWYQNDRDRFESLAQKLQLHAPRSRYYCMISAKPKDPKLMQELANSEIGDERLDHDEAYEAWTLELRKKIAAARAAKVMQAAQAAQAAVPKTPFNEARHALAVYQFELRTIDAKIAKAAQELSVMPEASNQRAEAQVAFNALQEERKKHAGKGRELEEAVGKELRSCPVLYTVMETCWNPRYAYVQSANASACIFSAKETADKFMKILSGSKNKLYLELKEIPQAEAEAFFNNLDRLGIAILLIDDGTEPVRILLKNVVPHTDLGFIENHNAGIRSIILRNLQASYLLQKHDKEMEEEYRLTTNDMRATLDRSMLQELGRSVLFIPCSLPEKITEQLRGNYAYTEKASARITELVTAEKLDRPAMNEAGFTGKHVVLNLPEGAGLPFRMFNMPDGKKWAPVFTGRKEAMDFFSRSKDTAGDSILAVTMEELQNLVKDVDGVLLDPEFFAISLTKEQIAKCIELRTEKRIQYNHHLKPAGDAKKPEEKN